MTTLMLNIKDDSKVQDVLRFLRDIDFIEVSNPSQAKEASCLLNSVIGELLDHPLVVKSFSPMARDTIYEH
jgi:hypothetical protein